MRVWLFRKVMEPIRPTDAPPEPEPPELPLFQHPEWMVGIVLISGGLATVAGLFNPIWWLIGSPCILALGVWIYGRVKSH